MDVRLSRVISVGAVDGAGLGSCSVSEVAGNAPTRARLATGLGVDTGMFSTSSPCTLESLGRGRLRAEERLVAGADIE